jgi:hypothetical protein
MKTKDEAIKALVQADKLEKEAKELEIQYGITERKEKAKAIKGDVARFFAAKGIQAVQLPSGATGRLITSVQERVWVGTREDMPEDAPDGLKPLKSLVTKEIWMKLSRRKADPEKIDQAVSDGLVTIDEIMPAYYERMRAGYVRIFEPEPVTVADAKA